MAMVIALAAAMASLSGSCRVEQSIYELRGAPQVMARFEPQAPTAGWAANVRLTIHSAKTGATYFFLPYSGNGQGIRTHFASVEDPSKPPDPDSARGRPLGDLDYLAADRSYRFDQSFSARSGEQAPAHLLIPGLQEALWYRADKREGVPLAFFDLAGCGKAKAP